MVYKYHMNTDNRAEVNRSSIKRIQQHYERHPSDSPAEKIYQKEQDIAYNKLIENFEKYFATYTGEKYLPENLRELAEAVFSKDCFVLLTPNGSVVPFETFYEQVEQWHLAGAKVRVLETQRVDNGFVYHLKCTIKDVEDFDDFDGTLTALAVVEAGKIVRIEPQGEMATKYDSIFKPPQPEEEGEDVPYEYDDVTEDSEAFEPFDRMSSVEEQEWASFTDDTAEQEEDKPAVVTTNLVAVGERTKIDKSPYRPKHWCAHPRKGFYTHKDYLRDVDPEQAKSTRDPARLHTYAIKKRWVDDELCGLTLREQDGKIYIDAVDQSTGALCLTKRSAFAYRDVRSGDRILAINGIHEFESKEHAEALIRYSEEVSLIVYKY